MSVELVNGRTWHGRRGGIAHQFWHSVDYLLVDMDAAAPRLRLFSRNRGNLASLRDRDHGGPPGHGRGISWARDALQAHRFEDVDGRILLLAQPRLMGKVFNPVSFWLCHDRAGDLRVVIAEVTNTFGDRHSYFCHRDDRAAIAAGDRLLARKVLHVSPFQQEAGRYEFTFDIDPEKISIRIAFAAAGGGGMVATLTGPRHPLTDRAILAACLRRPFAAWRVLGLIHFHALRLWRKGARYRNRPAPPTQEISR